MREVNFLCYQCNRDLNIHPETLLKQHLSQHWFQGSFPSASVVAIQIPFQEIDPIHPPSLSSKIGPAYYLAYICKPSVFATFHTQRFSIRVLPDRAQIKMLTMGCSARPAIVPLQALALSCISFPSAANIRSVLAPVFKALYPG